MCAVLCYYYYPFIIFIQNSLIRREPGLGATQGDPSEPTKSKKAPLSSPETSSYAGEAPVLGSAEIHQVRRNKRGGSLPDVLRHKPHRPQPERPLRRAVDNRCVVQAVYGAGGREKQVAYRKGLGEPMGQRDFPPANLPSQPRTRRFLRRYLADAVSPAFPASPSESWPRSGKARSKRKSDVRAKDDSDGASPIAVRSALCSVATMAAAIPSPGEVASSRPAHPRC